MIPMNPTVKFVIGLILVGAVGALKALGVVEPAWQWIGTVVQLLTFAEIYFTVPPSAAAKLKASLVKPLVLLMLVGLALLCAGCLSSAPVVPVTAANQAQVSSCENTASLHDGFVVGDIVVGGIGTGLAGAAAAVTDTGVRTGLGVGAAGAGAAAVALTALAEVTASNFVNSQCANVVGPLPTSALVASPGASQ